MKIFCQYLIINTRIMALSVNAIKKLLISDGLFQENVTQDKRKFSKRKISDKLLN